MYVQSEGDIPDSRVVLILSLISNVYNKFLHKKEISSYNRLLRDDFATQHVNQR